LKNYTLQVAANMRLPNLTAAALRAASKYSGADAAGRAFAVQAVIYIIKENRATQVLASEGRNATLRSPCSAPRSPESSRAAEEFVLLDNLYATECSA